MSLGRPQSDVGWPLCSRDAFTTFPAPILGLAGVRAAGWASIHKWGGPKISLGGFLGNLLSGILNVSGPSARESRSFIPQRE